MHLIFKALNIIIIIIIIIIITIKEVLELENAAIHNNLKFNTKNAKNISNNLN